MKLKTTLTFFSLLTITFLLMNNAAGPGEVQGKDRTGSPLSEGACNVCHNDGAFNPAVSVELLKDNQPVDKYQPGETYNLKVTISPGQGDPPAFGFQAVALSGSNNDNAGSWGTPPTGIQTVTVDNRDYVEHSTPSSSNNSFEVEWTAPQAGTGEVRIYAAGNAVNLNGENYR